MIFRAIAVSLALTLPFSGHAQEAALAKGLVETARAQVGVTTIYDPSYVGLTYPMGDIARERGVCSDVVIRALRDTGNVDLQQLVHEDMSRNFARYPTIWGLKRTDKNIDHRRVPNLEVFFERQGLALPAGDVAEAYQSGDIVTWRLPGNLPHIGIISDRSATDGTPLVIHNIGAGAQEENILFLYKIVGHYRPALGTLGTPS